MEDNIYIDFSTHSLTIQYLEEDLYQAVLIDKDKKERYVKKLHGKKEVRACLVEELYRHNYVKYNNNKFAYEEDIDRVIKGLR